MNELPPFHDRITDQLSNISLCYKDVLHELNSIDVNKAVGPDLLSGIILKACSHELATPLCILFNRSLNLGVFPTAFKDANVTPVFKSGDKSKVVNYRPISLLPLVSKVFERLVYAHLFPHIREHISESQHGFMKGRSTQTNLVNYIDFITDTTDNKLQVDIIYTDFSKAFDTVSHTLLSHKLSAYGFSGNVMSWLSSYLQNRTQRVVINGHMSSPCDVTSGVPQGSLIGPLLFILFVNDMPDIVNSHGSSLCSMYADDAKIYRIVRTQDDCISLQTDINNVYKWCNTWKLKLNVGKCNVITFSNKKKLITYNYSIADSPLVRVHSIKDLGILLSSQMSFSTHIDSIVRKAFRMMGFIKRTCANFSNISTLRSLYVTHVRSHLEYCSVIWSPWQVTQIDKIERVQQKFIKFLCFKSNVQYTSIDYDSLCARFKLPPLVRRRKFLDAIFVYKLVNSCYNCPSILYKVCFNVQSRQLRNNHIFRISASRVNLRKYSPILRCLTTCNDVFKANPNIDLFSPVSAFRRVLQAACF